MIARIFNIKFDQDNSHHEFTVKNHTSTPKSKKFSTQILRNLIKTIVVC